MAMYLFGEDVAYGLIGDCTEHKGIYVGDIFHVKDKENGDEINLLVIYDNVRSRYTMMGLMAYSIDEIKEYYDIEKILNHDEFSLLKLKELEVFNGIDFYVRENEY